MVQKRHFVDEELYEISSKHPRQLKYNQLVSSLEFASADFVDLKPRTSGEDEGEFSSKSSDDENGVISDLLTCSEKESGNSDDPECMSYSTWATNITSKHDARLEIPFHIPFPSEFCNSDHSTRINHYADLYSACLEYPVRKSIPIGPDYQAVIPEWRPQDKENVSIVLPEAAMESEDPNDETKLAGICIIPFPEPNTFARDDEEIGSTRTDCYCRDVGSIRCVRQHIMEAREKLRGTIGQQEMEELGFSDMGEFVAEKWSLEDEQLFLKVVFSYPASLGKNFWDHLSRVFPLRTKKDIVSYYFNVFMLRKRAEQNRFDPMNVDSDNDEWQGSDDDEDDDSGDEGDEMDTVEYNADDIDSSEYHDIPSHIEFHEEDDMHHAYDDKDIFCVSETRFMDDHHHALESSRSFLDESRGDRNVPTSIDVVKSSDCSIAEKIKINDNSKAWLGTENCVVNGGHEYVMELPCDAKVWDVGYNNMSLPKTEEDFLPTCSVIEEVFGVGSWNYNKTS